MSRTSPIPDDDTHTIFLLQRTSHQNTRTFYDYPSIVTFAQGQSLSSQSFFSSLQSHTLSHAFLRTAVVTMFEEHLRAKNPGRPTVNYGFPELTQFIDSFYDVSALTFVPLQSSTHLVHFPHHICSVSWHTLQQLQQVGTHVRAPRQALGQAAVHRLSPEASPLSVPPLVHTLPNFVACRAPHLSVLAHLALNVPLFARLDLQIFFFSIRFFFSVASVAVLFFFFLLFLCFQN